MSYSSSSVANYFLEKSQLNNNSQTMNPMKVLKLVYFAHGWHLAFYDKPLIHEQVEAWRYGPVIPNLYHKIKRYGNQPVEELVKSDKEIDTEDTIELLDKVWDVYGFFNGVELSEMTHTVGSPWDQVYQKYRQRGSDIPDNTDIDIDIIDKYFKGLKEKNRKNKSGG